LSISLSLQWVANNDVHGLASGHTGQAKPSQAKIVGLELALVEESFDKARIILGNFPQPNNIWGRAIPIWHADQIWQWRCQLWLKP